MAAAPMNELSPFYRAAQLLQSSPDAALGPLRSSAGDTDSYAKLDTDPGFDASWRLGLSRAATGPCAGLPEQQDPRSFDGVDSVRRASAAMVRGMSPAQRASEASTRLALDRFRLEASDSCRLPRGSLDGLASVTSGELRLEPGTTVRRLRPSIESMPPLRAYSDSDVLRTQRLDAWEVVEPLEGVDLCDRHAFGLAPTFFGRPVRKEGICEAHRVLLAHHLSSENLCSARPLWNLFPTLVGKLGIALGSAVLAAGISHKTQGAIWGGTTAILVGVVAYVGGMYLFSRDMARLNPGQVRGYLVGSIVGICVVAGALVLAQSDLGEHNLTVRLAGSLPLLGLGLLLLSGTMPLAFSSSEIVHGDIVRRHRNYAPIVLVSLGFMFMTGITLSRGQPNRLPDLERATTLAQLRAVLAQRHRDEPAALPFGVAQGTTVLGIYCVTLAMSMVGTNVRRLYAKNIEASIGQAERSEDRPREGLAEAV